METVVSLFGVQPLRIGGTEAFTRELSLQLAGRGWRHVAVFSGPPAPAVSEYFADLNNLTIGCVPEMEMSTLGGVPAVRRILAGERPRIVHFHFTNFLGPFPWLARLAGAEKVFFTAHGSSPTGFVPHRAPFWKRLTARVINRPLTQVICVSENVRHILRTVDMIPGSHLQRVYDAIYVPSLEDAQTQGLGFRRRFGIPVDKDLVVQVSWIIPEKGVPDLLEAAKLVLAEKPNTHFAFAGNGDYTEEYQQLAKTLGIADSVTWCGILGNPMKEGIYAAADVFCLLSRWEEAFGWVIAEAMAFEKPVVSTTVGGIPEVVEEGVTGLLGPRNRPEIAARHLLRLLGDQDLRKRMGQAGRRRVAEKFSLPDGVRALLGHYGI